MENRENGNSKSPDMNCHQGSPKRQSIVVQNLEPTKQLSRRRSLTIAHLYLSSASLSRPQRSRTMDREQEHGEQIRENLDNKKKEKIDQNTWYCEHWNVAISFNEDYRMMSEYRIWDNTLKNIVEWWFHLMKIMGQYIEEHSRIVISFNEDHGTIHWRT